MNTDCETFMERKLPMNLENVKYDAFISYRHCELDKFVAENLHKQLEAFKVPKSLIKTGKTNGKTKIERVFRDRDELPLASNLADPITQALQGSDYLIVICSPRLPESKWCLKEIETFIEMHGRDHVLAVLIEGEPADSFPDILRYDEREVTDENGNKHTIKVEVEPLAADVRGKDNAEVLKQIKNELMRLIAPMLGCNYDDLKMRHKEARQKRILRISLAISIVCIIFTAISTTMALTINKQANTIEEQYRASLEAQAISHASISQTLLEQEDRMAAIAIARIALPDSLEQQKETPYTAAAEYALSDSLGIYNNGEMNTAVKTLEQRSPIQIMFVSPEETTVATVDANNVINLYDITTGATLITHKSSYTMDVELYSKSCISFWGNDKLVYIAEDGFCIYDITTQEETFIAMNDDPYYITGTYNGEYIAVSTRSDFNIYNKEQNQIYNYIFPEGFDGDKAIAFDQDKSLCAFTFYSIHEDGHTGSLALANYKTGELIYSVETKDDFFDKCIFYGNNLITVGRTSLYASDILADGITTHYVSSYSLSEETPNWIYETTQESFDSMTGATNWENNTIVAYGNKYITFIDSKTGEAIDKTTLGDSIVDVAPLNTEGYVLAITNDGSKIYITYDPNDDNLVIDSFNSSNGVFADFYQTAGFSIGHQRNSTSAKIYQRLNSDQLTNLATLDSDIYSAMYSEKQNAFVVTGSNYTSYLKHEDSEAAITLDYSESVEDTFFVGENDEQFVLVNFETMSYFDTKTGELLNTLNIQKPFEELDTQPTTYLASSNSGETILLGTFAGSMLYFYSSTTETGTSVSIPKEAPTEAKYYTISKTGNQYAIAYPCDDSLCVYDSKTNELLAETTINASLVSSIIISEETNNIFVCHLDRSVTVYDLSNLSIKKTYTNIKSGLHSFQKLNWDNANMSETAPTYILQGTTEAYLLNSDLEIVARIYNYLDYDANKQCFYLSRSNELLSVPYYDYDMLIQEADKALQYYELSDYRKNQLGINQ